MHCGAPFERKTLTQTALSELRYQTLMSDLKPSRLTIRPDHPKDVVDDGVVAAPAEPRDRPERVGADDAVVVDRQLVEVDADDLPDDDVLIDGMTGDVPELHGVDDLALHRAPGGGHPGRRDEPRGRHFQSCPRELALPARQWRRGLIHRLAQLVGHEVPHELAHITGIGRRVLRTVTRESEHRRTLPK